MNTELDKHAREWCEAYEYGDTITSEWLEDFLAYEAKMGREHDRGSAEQAFTQARHSHNRGVLERLIRDLENARQPDEFWSTAWFFLDAVEDNDDEDWHYANEFGIDAGSCVVALYHLASDYHGGQFSPGYRVLCKASRVYDPNGNGIEPDTCEAYAYEAFEDIINPGAKYDR